MGTTLTETHMYTRDAIPQSSDLSSTLFVIKIDNIASVIPTTEGTHASLYMDDL